jgi:hypothetical protein
MRTRKIKTDCSVAASVKHALRTKETPNADPDRTPANYRWPGDERAAMARYRGLLPEKVRKNGVRAVEVLMTASPEAYKTMDAEAYLRACDDWARQTFGADNIVQIVHHYDETTPHTSVLLVPIDPRGRLNARHYLGGPEKLQALQDSFAEAVGKPYGLERGIRGSRAKHRTIRAYYGSAMAIEASLQPPKRRLMETDDQYRDRYREQIQPLYEQLIDVEARIKRIKYQTALAIEEARRTAYEEAQRQVAEAYKEDIAKAAADRNRAEILAKAMQDRVEQEARQKAAAQTTELEAKQEQELKKLTSDQESLKKRLKTHGKGLDL